MMRIRLVALVLGPAMMLATQAVAGDIGWAVGQSVPSQPSRPVASPLSRPQGQAVNVQEKTGTAFFVDDVGHLLTARHAAEGCTRLVVAKEGRAVIAQLVALSSAADLALLKIPRTLGIAAVFPDGAGVGANDLVFASAYDRLAASRSLLANATVAASSAGNLMIDSDITFGASGAPVLDSRGLVQGIVSRKVGSSRVIAIGAGEAKGFLAANGVHFVRDDRSQIVGASARGARAASISARVTCSQG